MKFETFVIIVLLIIKLLIRTTYLRYEEIYSRLANLKKVVYSMIYNVINKDQEKNHKTIYKNI